MRNVICAIAKLENQYIREWVEWHLALGFSKIYIYDNNEPLGERFEDVLSDLIDAGRVEVFDVRGGYRFQLKSYRHFYRRYHKEFDWCAFIDVDEFITLDPASGYGSIDDFLTTVGSEYGVVHLNWVCYGDNDLLHYDTRGVVERFVRPMDDLSAPINNHVKSIVRGGMKHVSWKGNPHTPLCRCKICDESGNECDNSPFRPHSHEKVYIRHYFTKTVEEFIYGKLVRAGGNGGKYDMSLFYQLNRPTPEKEQIRERLVAEINPCRPSLRGRLKRLFCWW